MSPDITRRELVEQIITATNPYRKDDEVEALTLHFMTVCIQNPHLARAFFPTAEEPFALPEKILIGSITFSVLRCSHDDLGDDNGKMDPISGEIKIAQNLVEQTERHTLIHEIIHTFKRTRREIDVEGLAQTFTQLFRYNPILREIFFPKPTEDAEPTPARILPVNPPPMPEAEKTEK
jgi:hypothetical protein